MARKKETRVLELGDRFNAQVEYRGEGEEKHPVVIGYGAVFFDPADPGTEFPLWDDYVERIARGAFDPVMAQDVRALFNHDPNMIVGRNTKEASSLVLALDERGLRYEITPPDTQAGRDLITNVKSKHVTGSSFSFTVAKGGTAITQEGDRTIRTITKLARLWDVGPVTFPAYEGTEAETRAEDPSMAEALKDVDAFRAESDPESDPDRNVPAPVDCRAILDADLGLAEKVMTMT